MKCGFWAGGLGRRRRRKLGVPGAAGLGCSEPGVELPGVPAVSAITPWRRLCKRERPFCFEHLFLHRVSPFPYAAELVVACFGNAETSAHT